MISYRQALGVVVKEITALRKENLSNSYIVLDIASRSVLAPWEGYDENLPYTANIRSLCERVFNGELSLNRDSGEEGFHQADDDPYGSYVDWSSPHESGRFINRMLLTAAKHEKLRRKLIAA